MKLHNRVIAIFMLFTIAITAISISLPKASAEWQPGDYYPEFSIPDVKPGTWDYVQWAFNNMEYTLKDPVGYWYNNDERAKYYLDAGYQLLLVPNGITWMFDGIVQDFDGFILYKDDGSAQILTKFGYDIDTGELIVIPRKPLGQGGGGQASGGGGGRSGRETATDYKYNYYTEPSQAPTNNYVSYNTGDTINGNVLNIKDGVFYDYTGSTVTTYDIGNLVYNPVNQTYTFNTTNNYYYNIQYTYNYTYVTYIGSSAEYKGAYQLYYELPDGRSSADLTAEEVAGISLAFDVVNYDKVYTDTHTRALFHFDGDWNDSSYYSNVSEIIWTNNASITYLDSNSFNGSIYFPEGPTFRIKYGGNSLRPNYQAMTIQFRIYFNKDLNNPNQVNNVGVVGNYGRLNLMAIRNDGYICLIQRPGQNTFTPAAVLPSGVWSDVAIVCHGNLLNELYINGVKVQSTNLTNSDWTPYSMTGEVEFAFPYMKNYMQLDEVRIVDFAVYSSNYTPSPVPFDTNNVFVLPNLNGTESLTVAIQSDYSITGYRVGGVRPTFPNKGMVYMPVENSRVIDCQIYNGSYWESVECRLWTGERWIPIWAFDVITLKDLYDIAGTVADLPISSETGFWAWFQKQWAHFREWYSNLKIGSSKVDVDLDKHVEEGSSFSLLGTLGDILSSLVKTASSLVTTIFDGLFSGAASAISGFTSSFSSGSSVLEFANYEGADIWD